jgi:hypothetical protein
VNAETWANAAHQILQDLDKAYTEAKDYRGKLMPLLSWAQTAAIVTTKLHSILRQAA